MLQAGKSGCRQVTVLKHPCQAFLCRILIKVSYLCSSTFAFAFQTKIFIVSALERGNLDDDLVGMALFKGENSNAWGLSWSAVLAQEAFFISKEEVSDHRSLCAIDLILIHSLIYLFYRNSLSRIYQFSFVIIGRACFCFVVPLDRVTLSQWAPHNLVSYSMIADNKMKISFEWQWTLFRFVCSGTQALFLMECRLWVRLEMVSVTKTGTNIALQSFYNLFVGWKKFFKKKYLGKTWTATNIIL